MSTKAKTTKGDIYQMVTDRIIEQLEQGIVPWRKKWDDAVGMPTNLVSGKPYRGINILMLMSTGYASNYWLTYKQAKQLGGKVSKGELGYPVTFWKWFEKEDEDGEPTGEMIPMLRYYTVFNLEQCEGIKKSKLPKVTDRDNDPIAVCESIVDSMPDRPDIRHKEARAYYHPGFDYVNMPKLRTFERSEDYYGTLFHELVHSTGHEFRLKRPEVMKLIEFGSHDYSCEELVAEIGACFLSTTAGIAQDFDNSVAYIGGWLKRLKDDRKFILHASAKAQNAVDFILDAKFDKEQ